MIRRLGDIFRGLPGGGSYLYGGSYLIRKFNVFPRGLICYRGLICWGSYLPDSTVTHILGLPILEWLKNEYFGAFRSRFWKFA